MTLEFYQMDLEQKKKIMSAKKNFFKQKKQMPVQLYH